MTDDPGYAEWLFTAAKGCSCCPECWEVPCGGCQGGGVCDQFPCQCADDPLDEWLDLDDDEI